jgi:hypothetical protein
MTLRITTFSIITLSIETLFVTINISDTLYSVMFSVLSVMFFYNESGYADSHYAECRGAACRIGWKKHTSLLVQSVTNEKQFSSH